MALIPWDCLSNFVDGESSICDFPCPFLKVPIKVEKVLYTN